MSWTTMTRGERLLAIQRGYIAGRTNRQIAASLGTTKNSILALAWRWYLNADNASYWKATKHRPYPTNYDRVRKERARVPIEVRRARLQNKAKDAESRKAIDAINAIPLSDDEIAREIGIAVNTISNWRRGAQRVVPLMQQCVTDFVTKFNQEAQDGKA